MLATVSILYVLYKSIIFDFVSYLMCYRKPVAIYRQALGKVRL